MADRSSDHTPIVEIMQDFHVGGPIPDIYDTSSVGQRNLKCSKKQKKAFKDDSEISINRKLNKNGNEIFGQNWRVKMEFNLKWSNILYSFIGKGKCSVEWSTGRNSTNSTINILNENEIN